MAHTFDTSANVAGQTASSVTFSYTCGATASILILGITTAASAGRSVGSPTYAGLAFTQAGSTQTSGGNVGTSEIWYLLAPPTGTANSIVIPNTTTQTIAAVAASFICAPGLQSVLDVTGGGTGNSANPSVSVTTTSNGAAIFSMANDANTLTASGQTLIASGANGGSNFAAGYSLQATSGAIAMSWTASNGRWASSVMAARECSRNLSTLTGAGS